MTHPFRDPKHPFHLLLEEDSDVYHPRLLLKAKLEQLDGHRLQVTNFPDLGAAQFKAYREGAWVESVIVDSHQSIANQLELAVWDRATDDWIEPLRGLPYVILDCGKLGRTHTVREAHRLNSVYLWTGKDTPETEKYIREFCADIGIITTGKKKKKKKKDEGSSEGAAEVPGHLDLRKFYRAVFKRDINSVVHGVFLEKVAGRLRMPRLLSGFIDAYGVEPAQSGGVKNDDLLPSPKGLGLKADQGFGNVPYARTDYSPKEILGVFKIDLDQLQGYGLGAAADELLIALSLLKVRRLLCRGFKPRANCDLTLGGRDIAVALPNNGFIIPSEKVLTELIQSAMKICQAAEDTRFYAANPVCLTWSNEKTESDIKIKLPAGTAIPSSLPVGPNLKKEEGKGKKPAVTLTFVSGWTPELLEQVREAFKGNDAVLLLIDEKIADATESDEDDENTNDEQGD